MSVSLGVSVGVFARATVRVCVRVRACACVGGWVGGGNELIHGILRYVREQIKFACKCGENLINCAHLYSPLSSSYR